MTKLEMLCQPYLVQDWSSETMYQAQTVISTVDELSRSLPRTVSKSEMEGLLWKIKDMVEMNPEDLWSDLVATGIVGKPGVLLMRADLASKIRFGLMRLFTDLALKFRES